MKKFITVVCIFLAIYLVLDTAYYKGGLYIDLSPNKPVTTFVKADDKTLYLNRGSGYKAFEVKGVNMGSGVPGEWSTDFAVSKETYLRWFRQMQEMGANTLRIYTVQNDTFYNAFYEYNKNNPNPLWLIHGVWVNDYVQNSSRDAYSKDFYNTFLNNCKTMVDVIHGNKKISLGRMASAGHGSYLKDVSPWVIGYILGVEWEDVTVVYTDEKYSADSQKNAYRGKYMYTDTNATPFETMLTMVGDQVIDYETKRYKQQRLVAFSNWPTTDPFEYPENVRDYFMKCAFVDVEHIKTTESFLSGQFASYHVYPYYPDYLSYVKDWQMFGISDLSEFITKDGALNTYKAYLSLLTKHHTMPVVISEFGVSTGRGMAQRDQNTGRNQGNTSEKDQGAALVECFEDIRATQCAGGCVFTWQDEWFKRTWNTMYAVNLKRTPYWSDYQTNEQYFGLLSFDPGKEQSVCYVDGDVSEWTAQDVVYSAENEALSLKYDEKFIYFLIYKRGLNFEKDTLYLPIDTTPKTGSSFCQNYNLKFNRSVDFVVTLNGKNNSRVQVQERYESLRSTYAVNVYNFDTYIKENIPAKTSPKFVNIDMILQTATPLLYNDLNATAEVFETGKLTYGNANPKSAEFNSLADFMHAGDYIELKLPWQLLNFADPSRMQIHDDYYSGNYGVDFIKINKMYVGLVSDSGNNSANLNRRYSLAPVSLKGWNNKVTAHERLKSSYYILQSYWTKEAAP